jgi:hypothetical protein
MRTLAACLLMYMMTGCAAYNANDPHADAQGQTAPDRGPELCRDGTPPPCTPRS